MITLIKRIVVGIFNIFGVGLYYTKHPDYKSIEWNEYFYKRMSKKSYNIRVKFYGEVINILEQYHIEVKGKSVLDIGCGDGELLKMIKDKCAPSVALGIDSSYEAVKLAHYNGVDAIQADLVYYQKQSDYDIVFCTEVLEHLKNPRKAIQKILEFNPKCVIFTVPDGRKDTWGGHTNFWSEESWAVFLSEIFTDRVWNIGRLDNGNVLFCCIQTPGS